MIQFSKTERIASVICGILLFILAAFLSIAIILNIIDYEPEGSLVTLWNIGSTLINSYGFSSILIPGFLLVAGAFCFDSQWTVQRAMGLLVSILPFFTIVGAEKIVRRTVAFDSYTIMLVKLILLGVLTTLLVLTEYLVAMIVASTIQKKAAAKKGTDQNPDGETQTENTQTSKKGFSLFVSIKNAFAKPKEKTEVDEIDLQVEGADDDTTILQDSLDSEVGIDVEGLEEEPEQAPEEYQEAGGSQEKTIAVQRDVPQPKAEKSKSDDTEFNEPKIAENFFSGQDAKPVDIPHTTEELLNGTEDNAFEKQPKQSAAGTITGFWASAKNKFKDLMEFGKKRDAEHEEERQRRKEEARRAKEEVDIDDYFEEAAPVLPKINDDEEKERLYSDKRDNLRKDAFVNEHQRDADHSFIREETFDLEKDLYPQTTDEDSSEEADDDDIIRQFETGNLKLNENEFEQAFTDVEEEIDIDTT